MLDNLFNPQSVAVIGASTKPQKIGSLILKNIVTGGYNGQIFPVNPNSTNIQNLKTYNTINAIPEDIDVAIIATPASSVPEIVSDCVRKKVKFVIVISSGFKENGTEGEILENQIKEIIQNSNTRLLGVNCLGLISSNWNFNGSFAPNNLLKGSIAFMSQSGAFGSIALDWLSAENIGLKYFVSLGNKTDISEIDLLQYWQKDNSIKCIVGYLESIENGNEFRKLVEKISIEKPFVLLKPGKFEDTQKAISSHTGSMTGNYQMFELVTQKTGIIKVDTMQELFDLVKYISWQPIPQNTDTVIITNAGGPAVQAIDIANEKKIPIAKIETELKDELLVNLPDGVSVNNPIDILGDAKADRYESVLQNIIKKTNAGILLTLLAPQSITEPAETAIKIGKLMDQNPTRSFLTSFMGGKQLTSARALLKKNKIPDYSFPESAINVISYINNYSKWKKTNRESQYIKPTVGQIKLFEKIKALLEQVSKNINPVVPPHVVRSISNALSIPIPKSYFPRNVAEAIQLSKQFSAPIVLKLATEKILHKTELKGVYTNLSDERSIQEAYSSLTEVGTKLGIETDGTIQFIELQEQINNGLELIIGIKRDGEYDKVSKSIKGFGHTLLFGYGGTYTELFKDISTKLIPLSTDDIQELIKSTNVYKIISGYRGRSAFNIDSIVSIIVSISLLAQYVSVIKEIDINPFIVTRDKGYAVDLKIIVG